MINKKIMFISVLAEAIYKSRKELVQEFIELGYDIVIVAPEKDIDLDKYFPSKKLKYYSWKLRRTGLNLLSDYKSIKNLKNIIKFESPDIVYSFGGAKAAIYGTYAARKIVAKNFCMVNGLGSVFHGSGLKNRIIRLIMILMFKYSLNKSDLILFQNDDDLSYFKKKKIIKQQRTDIVNGSGVNLIQFPYYPVINKNIFLFVGRMLKDKGIYEYVSAAELIKENFSTIEFWVVGGLDSNPTSVKSEELDKWVKKGIIKYFGKVDDVSEYYQKSSVFVLPSYHEGTPRANLEAMATGRAVITTDTVGCKETVIDGYNGYLVPIRNTDRLVNAIKKFIENQDLLYQMGYNSFEIARDKYDVNLVNKCIIDNFLKG